ncbi:MAG: hypothetical protein NHG08_00605 [Candidatus Shikimatogenerans sp. JK-2022]|nr:hypothetical protein [Candidatus Shikimatogenerans bostrichidophilus]
MRILLFKIFKKKKIIIINNKVYIFKIKNLLFNIFYNKLIKKKKKKIFLINLLIYYKIFIPNFIKIIFLIKKIKFNYLKFYILNNYIYIFKIPIFLKYKNIKKIFYIIFKKIRKNKKLNINKIINILLIKYLIKKNKKFIINNLKIILNKFFNN